MTKRTRILLLALGIVTLAAAIWMVTNLSMREISYTDESVDIEIIAPAGS
ncbi:hypothetical protein [Brevundimonas sp.]